jgi:hypothetical protein
MMLRDVMLGALLGSIAFASDAAAQGMMLTQPRAPALLTQSTDVAPKRPWALTAHEAAPKAAGQLPNQATGPKRERVVRDICIGCDAP